jgi:Prolyl oligopeptidase, N-terminal beta-propeller domain
LVASYSFSTVSPTIPAAPATPKKPVVETYNGVKVQDDYQWLEDWNDPAVRVWSDAQNAHARAVLDALPDREQIRDRLPVLRNDASVVYSAPQHLMGSFFFLKSQPPKQQPFAAIETGCVRLVLSRKTNFQGISANRAGICLPKQGIFLRIGRL